jgi:cytochrome c553
MSRTYPVGRLVGFALGLACTARLASTALADTGNAAEGKAKSLACQACHISGNPTSQVPHLVGQRATYLMKQLKAFKAGDRKDDMMSAIATQLSDADIANLAAYWSAEPAGSDTKLPAEVMAIKTSKMTFPRAFPKGFAVYHSSFSAEDGAVSKSYVNAGALTAVRAGKPLPDGSMIMVVNYAAKLDDKKQPVREPGGDYAVDKALSYSGMEARAGWGKDIPELLRNGNWNYGLFTADKAPRAELNQAVCLACHKPLAADSYVFTMKALKEKAAAK